jgi:hypothetical protein
MEKKNTTIVSILFLILLVVMGLGLGDNEGFLAVNDCAYGTEVDAVSRPGGLGVFGGKSLPVQGVELKVGAGELSGALGDSLSLDLS